MDFETKDSLNNSKTKEIILFTVGIICARLNRNSLEFNTEAAVKLKGVLINRCSLNLKINYKLNKHLAKSLKFNSERVHS